VGFRFRKSIKLLPGFRLNLSKSGVSASIGGRGHTLNVGPKGTRATVGIPGTGLSYSEKVSVSHEDHKQIYYSSPAEAAGGNLTWLVMAAILVGVVFLIIINWG
jgi:uncharacterized protein DUF4236